MPLMNVWGTRSGDSLPAELRSGVKEWYGTDMMPSLRLSAGGAGLTGMSIHYGATEGPSGFRAYNWPPFGYRGMSGLGQGETCDGVSCFDVEGNYIGPDPSAAYVPPYPVVGSTAPPLTGSGPLQPGQTYDTGSTVYTDPSTGNTYNITYNMPAGSNAARTPPFIPAGQAVPGAPAGFAYVPQINALGQMIGSVLAVSQGQGVTTTATGMQVLPAGTRSTLTTVQGPGAAAVGVAQAQQGNLFSGGTGTMLMLGAGLLVVVLMMQRNK